MSVSFHSEDDNIVVQHQEDVTALLEDCADRRKVEAYGSKEMRHVARLPVTVIEEYIKKAGITYEEFRRESQVHLHRILMNPDNSKFRVWGGRLA